MAVYITQFLTTQQNVTWAWCSNATHHSIPHTLQRICNYRVRERELADVQTLHAWMYFSVLPFPPSLSIPPTVTTLKHKQHVPQPHTLPSHMWICISALLLLLHTCAWASQPCMLWGQCTYGFSFCKQCTHHWIRICIMPPHHQMGGRRWEID